MKTIAYLGPENTNTHAAARKRFGARAKFIHAPTVEDVFHLVEREEADHGVVPIENSLGGAVTHTQDRFVDFKQSPVYIQGEVELPIRHFLIFRAFNSKPLTIHDALRVYAQKVCSHPQALTQCHEWLNDNLPQAVLVETKSTADAVKRVSMQRSKGSWTVAIGPKELADNPLLESIEIPQERENKTRFLVLGLGPVVKGKANKTAIMFALQDKPGALYDVLSALKKHEINMSKIESHPDKHKAWQYMFFVDIEGHIEEQSVQKALKALQKRTSFFRVLGSYPIK